jgi:cytochrome c-type biogenesis protein CcmH/NrfG
MRPKLRKFFAYQIVVAKALGDIGRKEEALVAYNEAAKLDPKSAEAQAGIGWALTFAGRQWRLRFPQLLR